MKPTIENEWKPCEQILPEEDPIIPEGDVFEECTMEDDAGKRLDIMLSEKIPEISRNRIAQLISEGHATVGGKTAKASLRLKEGQVVVLHLPAPVVTDVVAQDIPLAFLYEDDDLLVVEKPKGMVVHPAPGNPDGTMVNALLYHCGDRLSDINGVIRPGIVHRIDKDTSGLLVVAKQNASHRALSEALQRHDISRRYLAVVDGLIREEGGTVNAPIGRHRTDRKRMAVVEDGGRAAVTHYRVLRSWRAHTLLECSLETGRTHQIRVHLASIGHPLTGDLTYGRPSGLVDTQGQALHAWHLSMMHPSSGRSLSFRSLPPDWLRLLWKGLEQREGPGLNRLQERLDLDEAGFWSLPEGVATASSKEEPLSWERGMPWSDSTVGDALSMNHKSESMDTSD